jgi:hypothetical protein
MTTALILTGLCLLALARSLWIYHIICQQDQEDKGEPITDWNWPTPWRRKAEVVIERPFGRERLGMKRRP